MDGVEVIVMQQVLLNGPDHKTIGRPEVGSRVTVAGGPYVAGLVESGLVAYITDFPGFDTQAEVELAQIDAAIDRAEAEAVTPDSGVVLEDAPVSPALKQDPARTATRTTRAPAKGGRSSRRV